MEIGDKITFRKEIKELNFETDSYTNIPSEMIIHGNTIFGEYGNKGIIEGFYGGFIICSYIDKDNKKVQLGFNTEDIITEINYEVY